MALRDVEIYEKTLHIEKLKAQLAELRRARFGRSSEQLAQEAEQLELALEELESSEDHRQPSSERLPAAIRRAKAEREAANRKPLPDHLPRERVEHDGVCACPKCGSTKLTQDRHGRARGARICAVALQGHRPCAARSSPAAIARR